MNDGVYSQIHAVDVTSFKYDHPLEPKPENSVLLRIVNF